MLVRVRVRVRVHVRALGPFPVERELHVPVRILAQLLCGDSRGRQAVDVWCSRPSVSPSVLL